MRLRVLLAPRFPWWGQLFAEVGHVVTPVRRPIEPRCPQLFRGASSLPVWNMRCSREWPLLLLLHFALLLAAGHEELSAPGSVLSLLAEKGQCFLGGLVARLLSARLVCFCTPQINVHASHLNCVAPSCRSVPVPVRPVHCPPGENHSWWTLHHPLRGSSLQGWAFQAWSATCWFGGTGLLQGQLQGSLSDVQPDRKPSPSFKQLHPWEEERRCRPDGAPILWREFLPSRRDSGKLRRARDGCSQHL